MKKEKDAIINNPEAKPSIPSIQLNAFITPTIQKLLLNNSK